MQHFLASNALVVLVQEGRHLDDHPAILEAEARAGSCEAQTIDPATLADHVRSAEAFADLAAAQQEVARLYARWEELEAIVSGRADPT